MQRALIESGCAVGQARIVEHERRHVIGRDAAGQMTERSRRPAMSWAL
jgi:hypothetical protein